MPLMVNFDISKVEKIITKKLQKKGLWADGLTERIVYSPKMYKALCAMVKKDLEITPEIEELITHMVDDLEKEWEEYCFETSGVEITPETTARGFEVLRFKDRYNEECSLQESSLATEAAVWLGVDTVIPKVCTPGIGWKNVKVPEDALMSGRMHLTATQLAQLVPRLINFVVKNNLEDENS